MEMRPSIVVIGLGYAGLPLAVALARSFDTTGFDLDAERVVDLRAGRDQTGEVDGADLRASSLKLTADAADCRGTLADLKGMWRGHQLDPALDRWTL